MSWNEPGADPITDIRKALSATKNAQDGLKPNTMIMSGPAWISLRVELIVREMDFGWWPLSWVRKRIMRWALRRYFTHKMEQQPAPPAED